MHITNERLNEYRQQVQVLFGKYSKKLSIAKICGIVSPIVFLLLSWVLTYCGILFFDRSYPVEEQTLIGLDIINKYCEPIMKVLQFGIQPWYIVLPLCLCVIVLVPFGINVIIAVLISILSHGKKLTDLPSGQPIPLLKRLISYTETSGRYVLNPLEDSRRLINWLYVLFLVAIFGYAYIALKMPLEMVFSTAIGFAVVLAIVFWIYRVLLLAFGGLSGLLWSGTVKGTKDLAKKIKGDLITEERLKKEEADREKKAQERKIAAQKKKEAEAKRKAADAVYAEAIAGEEYDEELIEKAANMGSPDACLYHGRKLMKKWSTEHLTRAEKADVVKLAAAFLSTAASHNTEAAFLWILARSQYESNSKEQWTEMLQRVRKIKSSGQLPEEYEETCDLLLETLVGVIDATPEAPAPRRSYSPTPTTSSYTPASAPMDSHDKWVYIRDNCHGMYSWGGIQTIENDPNLTPSQKEELKDYLKIYGD